MLTRFRLRPSFIGMVVFIFIYLGGVFSVCLVMPGWSWALVVVYGVVHFVLIINKHLLPSNNSFIVEFWLESSDEWCLQTFSQKRVQATIKYPIFITNYLIVMVFILKDSGRKRSLLIFRDTLTYEEFRKLKLAIKSQR